MAGEVLAQRTGDYLISGPLPLALRARGGGAADVTFPGNAMDYMGPTEGAF